MITQQIKLNLIPGQVFPRVNASQYDSGTRTLQMALYNGDQVFNIASGMTAFVQGTKPDKTGFQYAATITEGSNIATLDITQQMTAVSGEVVCELVITSGDDRIATVNFILFVEAAALADDTVISETDLPLIEEAVEAVQRIIPIAQQVAEDAQTASDAATAATAAQEAAAEAAQEAEEWGSHSPYIGQNGNWYIYNTTTQQFEDSGVEAQGPQGETGPQGPQGVQGETGPQGPTGATGNGIVSISKTSTSGLVDTYTILFTNGTSTTFTVTNGQDGQGSGDMTKAVYDASNAVADAGGIVAYVQAHSGAGTLAGLDDVTLSNLATGQSLVYNATTQKWENAQISYSNLSGKPTLGTAASKNSTNTVAEDSTDLVESGAVYSELALKADSDKAYQTDDTTETTLASDDIIPFYDISATAKRKMTVQKFGEQLISNPNLLDNPWFTVNQRGETTYENPIGNTYCFDRWRTGIGSGATQGEFKVVQNSDGSINLVNNSSIYCNFVQPLENDFVKRIQGKTVTLSIRFADDTILYNSGVVDASINTGEIPVPIAEGTNLNVRCFGDMSANVPAVIQIAVKPGITVSNIKAIKLELGSVSTLAMDTAPNYQQELAKCQRYFYGEFAHKYAVLGYGYATSTTSVRIKVPLSVLLRVVPSITIDASLTYIFGNGGSIIPSNITVQGLDSNGVQLNVTVTNAVLNELYILKLNNTSLALSANL